MERVRIRINIKIGVRIRVRVRITVDAMEVLIKYFMNSFPQVDQFIRIQISFYFLCVPYWSIGSETKS